MAGALTPAQLKALLQEWSQLLVSRAGEGEDLAGDTDGSVHNKLNTNRNVCLVYGTWGDVDFGTRTLHSNGKKLFIVAGSSHATSKELANGVEDTPANLKKLASKIHTLWMNPVLFERHPNGEKTFIDLVPVETDGFKVNIHPMSRYRTLTNITAGETSMGSMAQVGIFTVPAGQKAHLVLAGQSSSGHAGGKNPERYYNVNVEFDID